MRLTALWWWIDRWRKSSAFMDMTLEEQGAYRNLLDEAHLRGGPLPNDDRILAKACGDAIAWPRIRAVVLARFAIESDGCWHNATLDGVYAKSAEISQQRSQAGKNGNEKRWNRKPIANGVAKPSQNSDASLSGIANGIANTIAPSPSPSPSLKEQEHGPAVISNSNDEVTARVLAKYRQEHPERLKARKGYRVR